MVVGTKMKSSHRKLKTRTNSATLRDGSLNSPWSRWILAVLVIGCIQIFIAIFHHHSVNQKKPTESDLLFRKFINNEPATILKKRRKQRRDRAAMKERSEPVGTFNQYKLYHRSNATSYQSSVHCLGENFHPTRSWVHRSCKFRNLCFDMTKKDFVLFRSQHQKNIEHGIGQYHFLPSYRNQIIHMASTMENVTVSLGGINPNWNWNQDSGIESLEWFPHIIDSTDEEYDLLMKEGYYELPDNAIFVPYHSFAGGNVGHLVWDDFLPIFSLLELFDLHNNEDDDEEEEMMVWVRFGLLKDNPRALWGTCNLRDYTLQMCEKFFRKFLPLMGLTPERLSTTEDYRLDVKWRRSRYICSKTGVAGLGMLTDHGTKRHGWKKEDFESSHNHGRGKLLYDFRNYMLRNMGYDMSMIKRTALEAAETRAAATNTSRNIPSFHVTFSLRSSTDKNRNLDWSGEIKAVDKAFQSSENATYVVNTQGLQYSYVSVAQQINVTLDTTILVTACGGGAMTSMFLPKGAILILYYDEGEGYGAETGKLDWDYLNNLGYLNVHWLPIRAWREHQAEGLEILVNLIRHEIENLVQQL